MSEEETVPTSPIRDDFETLRRELLHLIDKVEWTRGGAAEQALDRIESRLREVEGDRRYYFKQVTLVEGMYRDLIADRDRLKKMLDWPCDESCAAQREELARLRAVVAENYPLLLDGTWYDDHDAATERLGRIRETLGGTT